MPKFNKHKLRGKRENAIKIEMINGDIKIKNQALCTKEQVQEAIEIVKKHTPELIKDLPDDHPWKTDKLIHGITVISEIKKSIYKYIGDALPQENYALISFFASAHDLGRAIEAKKKLKMLPENYRPFSSHGEESVNLLKDWGALDKLPQNTREIIKYVILHHTDKLSPVLPENSTELDKLKHFYACVFRDLDKLAIFRNKTNIYLNDEKEKAKQTQVNNLTGETGKIEPEELIKEFAEFQAVDELKCRSYEAYILQHLAWIFDLNLKTSLREAASGNAIPKILKYFKRMIPSKQYEDIYKATETYLNKAGHSLKKSIK